MNRIDLLPANSIFCFVILSKMLTKIFIIVLHCSVHWMPVEFFADMSLAKRSVVGDIWAFATTLWEVFSYGQSPTDSNPVLTARVSEQTVLNTHF